MFYDRLQLIQADRMPKFIEDSDCRVSLYRNCRNTENIATTSLRPINNRNPKLMEDAIKGKKAKMYFRGSTAASIATLDKIIDAYKTDGCKDIVILTVKTEDKSILSSKVTNGLYRQKYRFSTCRKFKGLEADAVILIDVDRTTFESDNVMMFYVGTSRARLYLDIIASISKEDCASILQNTLHSESKIEFPEQELAAALNTRCSVELE